MYIPLWTEELYTLDGPFQKLISFDKIKIIVLSEENVNNSKVVVARRNSMECSAPFSCGRLGAHGDRGRAWCRAELSATVYHSCCCCATATVLYCCCCGVTVDCWQMLKE